MVYRTIIHLVNVKIKKGSIPFIAHALDAKIADAPDKIRRFLDVILIDGEGRLHLKKDICNFSSYGVQEEGEGLLYHSHEFAEWLKPHCEKGGRIIEHSETYAGTAWGWEFDGTGGISYFKIDPTGIRK
jgi:hypothetical protein